MKIKRFNENINESDTLMMDLFNKYLKEFKFSYGDDTDIEGLGVYTFDKIKNYDETEVFVIKSLNKLDDVWTYIEYLTIEDVRKDCQEYVRRFAKFEDSFGGFEKEYESIIKFLLNMIEDKEFIEEYNLIKDSEEIGLL